MKHLDNISIQEWRNLFKRLEAIVNRLESALSQDSKIILLDNADLLQLFKISHKTAQNWRDNNIIAFSQIGNKIYYRMDDIQKLLDENYNPESMTNKQL